MIFSIVCALFIFVAAKWLIGLILALIFDSLDSSPIANIPKSLDQNNQQTQKTPYLGDARNPITENIYENEFIF